MKNTKIEVVAVDMMTGEVKKVITHRDALGGITLFGYLDMIDVKELDD